ncbi:HAMP domain-containing histidine kinase [Tessaracoccus sp. OS52]|uniref:sensor histidine kinase n=1 Tax=Tessaracoccus sp. OS52 TaxID=2886691 RepID=UPI001D0F560F|nr:HAMP domain-containing sensor histidine kinase [Tessaracoccus sp. OS52]MCC2593883.1 HAMP domain-containing histidine kinase [Tessaracoccus sp. OS52]
MIRTETPPEPPRVSIRQRISLAMVLLAVFVLAATGTLVFLLEGRSIERRVADDLELNRQEFVVLATEGVDPTTGVTFAGPSELLRTYLARSVLSVDEGEIGFVEGQVEWVSSEGVQFRPEDDDELMRHVQPLTSAESVTRGRLRTGQREYYYIVTPVHFPEATGALVQVHNLDGAREDLDDTMVAFLVVALGASVAAAVVAWLLVGELLKPVEELRAAAEAIGEHDLTTRVPERGNDDLTRLSMTINRMLDRLQAAVEGQRTLLDDVGHELRTPLTIVRGHLELMDVDDPADVRQTRELAMDELDRMGGLVGDLLTLAKSQQGDFVRPRWTSLATLTDQTFEKARALGDRSWRLRHVESSDAWLDPDRITQAWLQLAANAVKYSEPGSAVTFSSELVQGEVHLSVEDNGSGIHPEDLERIRQRFGRGRATDGHSGAGLGLSIVESIVAAHDGRLDIQSEPGVGSTFTLALPLAPQKETS